MKFSLLLSPPFQLFVVVTWIQMKMIIYLVILIQGWEITVKNKRIEEISVLHLVGERLLGPEVDIYTIILKMLPFQVMFMCISGKVEKGG